MKAVAAILMFSAVIAGGCHHARNLQGGCLVMIPPKPVITLHSVTPTHDSPGRGSTFFPFPPPVYPYEMLRAGIAGEVVVRVTVGTDGRVERSDVLKSTQQEFARPAALAAEQWQFFEFRELGVKERRKMILDCRIVFELSHDDDSPVYWGATLSQRPNKAPEPTPTSVMPRASERRTE